VTSVPAATIAEQADRVLVLVAKVFLAGGLCVRLLGDAATGDRVLGVGLLALMATPALRLLGTFIADARRGDWLSLSATLGVVAVLAWSIATAFR